MSLGPNKYPPLDPRHIIELVERHPLASIISCRDDDFTVTPLPLRPRVADDGTITHFVGHFARSNPHVTVLREHSRALLLFRGENSYVSPSWMSDRTWAPTWNHLGAQFVVEIDFQEDPAVLREVLRDMIDTREAGRPNPWRLEETGARYEKITPRIIAFQARVLESKAVFKLGQDERASIYGEMVRGLAEAGETELVSWTQRYNAHR